MRCRIMAIVTTGVLLASVVTARASRPSLCSSLSASEVGRRIGQAGVSAQPGLVQTSEGVSGAMGTTASCSYNRRGLLVAILDVFQMASDSAAGSEFNAEIRMADKNGIPRTVVHGPWAHGFQFATEEVYALKGRIIIHFQLVQGPKPMHFKQGIARELTASVAARIH
jgi:hypothetical protein